MAKIRYDITSMTRGLLTDDMSSRIDTEFYLKGLKDAVNIDLLPHGPVKKICGTGMLYELSDKRTWLLPFIFDLQEQYILAFSSGIIEIYRNSVFQTRLTNNKYRVESLAITVAGTGYAVDEVLTFTGGGGDGATATIASVGGGGEILSVVLSHEGWDYDTAPTVGITTAGGSGATITATLSTNAYSIPWTWDEIEPKELNVTSSADTMFIFHTDHPTHRLYRQSSDTKWDVYEDELDVEPGISYIDTKDIQLKSSANTVGTNRDLYSDVALFTSSWVGRFIYLREGYGQITSFVNSGQVKWEIKKKLSSDYATYTKIWEESIESADRGYAGGGILFQDRLYKFGFKSKPTTVAASQTGDYVNFDDTEPDKKTSGFIFTMASDTSDRIKNAVAKDSLQFFTDGAEWLMSGNPTITPTDVMFNLQTTVGSLDIPPVNVDNETYFVANTGDQMLAFKYSFDYDSYITNNYSIVSSGLLQDPKQLAYLKSWLGTQANYVYIVNGNGQILEMGISVEQDILGWTRYEYGNVNNETANVHSIAVCKIYDEQRLRYEDRLFMVVERENGAYLEVMSGQTLDNGSQIHLLSYAYKSEDPATDTFTDLDHLVNQTVSVINAAGEDLGDYIVGSDGTLTLDYDETEIYVGLPYEARGEIMNIDFAINGQRVRGEAMRIMKVLLDVKATNQLTLYEGNTGEPEIEVSFRDFDNSLADSSIALFSGLKEEWLDAWADECNISGRQLSVGFKSNRPLTFQVNGLSIYVK